MQDNQTNLEFEQVISLCRRLYMAKLQDYGAAWHILRSPSLTDQIFIKAKRIRTFQITGEQKVEEDIRDAFAAIVNYSIMALIQLELGFEDTVLPASTAARKYDEYAKKAFDLMVRKNHDYGEAWRSMRISSLVDIILMKILRTKQIEDAGGKTLVSEGLDANYYDMLNYAVFALIQLGGGIGTDALPDKTNPFKTKKASRDCLSAGKRKNKSR
ncbi:MAG: DUF1599 domain-containing protein [Bacteroidales bacterium]|nr:DUF1599 domain-containing protein [Bacteroidales bacterium]